MRRFALTAGTVMVVAGVLVVGVAMMDPDTVRAISLSWLVGTPLLFGGAMVIRAAAS